jgi:hypothetical protein
MLIASSGRLSGPSSCREQPFAKFFQFSGLSPQFCRQFSRIK